MLKLQYLLSLLPVDVIKVEPLVIRGNKSPKPLILRANKGDWIEVTLNKIWKEIYY